MPHVTALERLLVQYLKEIGVMFLPRIDILGFLRFGTGSSMCLFASVGKLCAPYIKKTRFAHATDVFTQMVSGH